MIKASVEKEPKVQDTTKKKKGTTNAWDIPQHV